MNARPFAALVLTLLGCPLAPSGDRKGEGETAEGEGEGEGESENLQFCTTACVADDDAPGGGEVQRCQDGGCVYVGCSDDGDCADGFSCGPSELTAGLNDCFVACAVDDDCGGTYSSSGPQRCRTGQCRGVGCTDDAECVARLGSAAYACASQERGVARCIFPCDVYDDCVTAVTGFPFDLVCTDGECRVGACDSDADCPEAFGRDEVCR
jgi:hypothetical protein